MKKYWSYLIKVTTRNKFNIFPVVLCFFISIFILVMNTKVQDSMGYIGSIEIQNQNLNGLVTIYNNYDENDIDENDMKEINEEKDRLLKIIENNNKAIKLAKEKKWKESIEINIDTIQETDLKILEDDNINSSLEYEKTVLTNMERLKYLAKNNLEPDAIGMETQGFPFTFRLMDVLFPVITIICFITILTNMFTTTFKQGIDIDNLFPMKKYKLILSKLIFGIATTFGIYIIMLVFSFILASIMNGSNSLKYPININTMSYNEIQSLKNLMISGLAIQFLCTIFTVLFVYIIAFITHNKIATIFTSILFLCGTTLGITNIQPLFSIIHYIPTTYFNTMSVLTNDIAINSNNSNVTFVHGIISLLFCIVIELLLIFIINNKYKFIKKAV